MANTEKPLFMMHPNIENAIIPRIIASLGTAIFITIFQFVFIIYTIFVNSFNIPTPALVLALILIFLLIWAFPVFMSYMTLHNTEYRFYKDRVEYHEGWITIHRHTVPYKKITDITLKKTIWNRLFDTATIGLLTAGSHFNSVNIPFINNPENVYQHLQKKILKLGKKKTKQGA